MSTVSFASAIFHFVLHKGSWVQVLPKVCYWRNFQGRRNS